MLGGLYTLDDGAHSYWLKGGQFPAKPHGLINLVHYEDAAIAFLKCLENPDKIGGEVFLVSDGAPMSRQEIVDADPEQDLFVGKGEAVIFTGGEEVDGKKYKSQKIRNMLGWEPSYKSLADFYENWMIYPSLSYECQLYT